MSALYAVPISKSRVSREALLGGAGIALGGALGVDQYHRGRRKGERGERLKAPVATAVFNGWRAVGHERGSNTYMRRRLEERAVGKRGGLKQLASRFDPDNPRHMAGVYGAALGVSGGVAADQYRRGRNKGLRGERLKAPATTELLNGWRAMGHRRGEKEHLRRRLEEQIGKGVVPPGSSLRVSARTPSGRFVSHENDLKVIHIRPKRKPTSELRRFGKSWGSGSRMPDAARYGMRL